jgi:hypothetical protein
MSVRLHLTSDNRVEVVGYLTSLEHGNAGPITFMMDTGSQRTILGPRDAEALGFRTSSFPRYAGPQLIGVGGRGSAFSAGVCEIILGDNEIVGDEEILYFMPGREKDVRSRDGGLRYVKRERTFQLPSVLGTGFLSKKKCVLSIDYGKMTGEILRHL